MTDKTSGCFAAVRESGYAQAIIGSVGPKEFCAKAVDAKVIEG